MTPRNARYIQMTDKTVHPLMSTPHAPQKSHDLNARAFALMREHGIPWREARRRLGQHGAAVRNANRHRTEDERRRASRFRDIADKISP